MKFKKLEISSSDLMPAEKEYVRRIESNLKNLESFEFKEPLNFSLSVTRKYDKGWMEEKFKSLAVASKKFPYGLPHGWSHKVVDEKVIYYLKHYDSYLILDTVKKNAHLYMKRMPPYILRLMINDSLNPILDAHSLHSACFSDKDGAHIIIGNKNSGKTTLLLSALEMGFKHVSDDINFIDCNLNAYPYNFDSMLWPRQINRFNLSMDSKRRRWNSHNGKYILELDKRYDTEKSPRKIKSIMAANINFDGKYSIREVSLQKLIPNAVWKERMWVKPFLKNFDIKKWYENEISFWKDVDVPCHEVSFDFDIPKIQKMLKEVTKC